MCGRYALHLRPSQVRHRLADQNMPADEAPSDDDTHIRQTYNFPPGANGLIYRAATSERGGQSESNENGNDNDEPSPKKAKLTHTQSPNNLTIKEPKYKIQAAKWGLIPFWTKRPPDYSSQLRTINCRDDSLIENRGMWNTMKQRKRCVVVAEGFYEWLKKGPSGKEKVPHFVKRADGGLMCFAGLWDCVHYQNEEGKSDGGEGLYSYTVITTASNAQLKFLHDRMPVILEPGSEAMRMWLDPQRVGWDKELQGMLKPFEGELECYAVDKAVGKVGNDSASFVVPVDSKENKKNIANFFGRQREKAEEGVEGKGNVEGDGDGDERATTTKAEDPESNAPLPIPKSETAADDKVEQAIKQDTDSLDDSTLHNAADERTERDIKREISEVDDEALIQAAASPPPAKRMKTEQPSPSPVKSSSGRKTRSATTNGTVAKTPTKEGNKRITAFFGK